MHNQLKTKHIGFDKINSYLHIPGKIWGMNCNVVQQIRIHPFRHCEKITIFVDIFSQNEK